MVYEWRLQEWRTREGKDETQVHQQQLDEHKKILSDKLTERITDVLTSKTTEKIDIHALLTSYSETERMGSIKYEKEMFFAAAELEKVTIRNIAYQDLLKLINNMISPHIGWLAYEKVQSSHRKKPSVRRPTGSHSTKLRAFLELFSTRECWLTRQFSRKKETWERSLVIQSPRPSHALPVIIPGHLRQKNMWIRIYDMLSVAIRIDHAEGMTENVEKAMKLMSVLIQRTKNTPPMELTVDKLFKY